MNPVLITGAAPFDQHTLPWRDQIGGGFGQMQFDLATRPDPEFRVITIQHGRRTMDPLQKTLGFQVIEILSDRHLRHTNLLCQLGDRHSSLIIHQL